jgi:hypothetical protein
MLACNNQLSRTDLLKKIQQDLIASGYSQTPQPEAEATKRQPKGLPEAAAAIAG